MTIAKLIPIIFISLIFCQFNNVEVKLETNRISFEDEQIFENFNYNIENYIKNNNFCPECEDMDIDLNLHFSIQKIVTSGSKKIVYSQLYISNKKDHYFFSRDIIFPYKKNKSMTFNPQTTKSLPSILNYYLYFFVALELDTWGLEWGNAYLNKIDLICDNLAISSYSSGWDDRKENVKKIKSNKEYRQLRYLFYYFLENFKGFDSEEHNSRIFEIFEKIKYQHKKYGYEKNTLKLIQSYPEEFSKLFSAINLTDGIKLLIIFDEENKNIYEKYLR